MDWRTCFQQALQKNRERTRQYEVIIQDYQHILKNNNKTIQSEILMSKKQKEKMVENMLSMTDYLTGIQRETREDDLKKLMETKRELLLKLERLISEREVKIDTYLREIQFRDQFIESGDKKKQESLEFSNLLNLHNEELNEKLNLLQIQLETLENKSLPLNLFKTIENTVSIRKVKINQEGSLFSAFTKDFLYIYDLETCNLFSKVSIKGIVHVTFFDQFLSVVCTNDLYIFSILNLVEPLKHVRDDSELFKGDFLNEETYLSCHMKYLKVWDIQKGFSCTKVIPVADPGLDCCKFHNFVVTAHVNDVYIWDYTYELMRTVKTKQFITSVTANDDFLLISHQSCLEIYDVFKNQSNLMKSPDFEAGCLWNNAIISSNDEYIATGTSYGTILFWEMSDLKKTSKILKIADKAITSMDWSTNGKFIVAASLDHHVRVYKNI